MGGQGAAGLDHVGGRDRSHDCALHYRPAGYHNFWHLGSLAPGYQADVVCFDSLSTFEPTQVWQRGQLVARHGAVIDGVVPNVPAPEKRKK